MYARIITQKYKNFQKNSFAVKVLSFSVATLALIMCAMLAWSVVLVSIDQTVKFNQNVSRSKMRSQSRNTTPVYKQTDWRNVRLNTNTLLNNVSDTLTETYKMKPTFKKEEVDMTKYIEIKRSKNNHYIANGSQETQMTQSNCDDDVNVASNNAKTKKNDINHVNDAHIVAIKPQLEKPMEITDNIPNGIDMLDTNKLIKGQHDLRTQKDLNMNSNSNPKLVKEVTDAIISNNINTVVQIFDYHKSEIDINSTDENGSSFLMQAVALDNEAMVNKILEYNPDLNIIDYNCNNALVLSVKLHNKNIIKTLLRNGANVEIDKSELSRAMHKRNPFNLNIDHKSSEEQINNTLQVGRCNYMQMESPLQVAARQCSYKIAQILIEEGARVNAKNYQGMNPLMIATLEGCPETIKTLIKNGANLNDVDKRGNTPLIMAAIYDDTYAIRILVDKGADITIRNNDNLNAIDVAFSQSNDIASIHSLIKSGNLKMPRMGEGNLHTAARTGQIDLLISLLKENADVDQVDQTRQTPIMYSIMANQRSALRTLIKWNANLNAVDNSEQTPLMIAIWNNRDDMVKILLQNNADLNYQNKYGETALMKAVQQNKTNIVSILLAWGSAINVSDNNGNTPLIFAVQQDNFKITKMLIEQGAFVNLSNKLGKAAISYVHGNSSTKITNILINTGAMVNKADITGNTPLMWTRHCKNPKIATLLIKNGANPHFVNNFRQTPFMVAAMQKNSNLMSILQKDKTMLNHQDIHGRTALMLSAKMGMKNNVNFLLRQKVNVNKQDQIGYTALMYAVENEEIECVKQLLRRKAKVEIKNMFDKTALDIAKSKNINKIINLLSKSHKYDKSVASVNVVWFVILSTVIMIIISAILKIARNTARSNPIFENKIKPTLRT